MRVIKSIALHLPASLPEAGTFTHDLSRRLSRQTDKDPGSEDSLPERRWLPWRQLPPGKRPCHVYNHPLPGFSFTPFLVPGPSLPPPAAGTEQQLYTKYSQQKGSTDIAKWPPLLYTTLHRSSSERFAHFMS